MTYPEKLVFCRRLERSCSCSCSSSSRLQRQRWVLTSWQSWWSVAFAVPNTHGRIRMAWHWLPSHTHNTITQRRIPPDPKQTVDDRPCRPLIQSNVAGFAIVDQARGRKPNTPRSTACTHARTHSISRERERQCVRRCWNGYRLQNVQVCQWTC